MKYQLEPGSSIAHPLLHTGDKTSGFAICLPDGEVRQLVGWLNTVAGTEHDALVEALVEALEHNAHNWHSVQDDPIRHRYCWCYHEDGTISPQCQDQPQCAMARAALAKARGEDS